VTRLSTSDVTAMLTNAELQRPTPAQIERAAIAAWCTLTGWPPSEWLKRPEPWKEQQRRASGCALFAAMNPEEPMFGGTL
jgi:hypothetical protein